MVPAYGSIVFQANANVNPLTQPHGAVQSGSLGDTPTGGQYSLKAQRWCCALTDGALACFVSRNG